MHPRRRHNNHHPRTPSSQTVLHTGFDLTVPCGSEEARDETGYSKQDIYGFAKQLRIPTRNKSLDCLCQEIRQIVEAKDAGLRLVLRNTERNLDPKTVTVSPAQQVQPVPPTASAVLSPAVTPMAFTQVFAAVS